MNTTTLTAQQIADQLNAYEEARDADDLGNVWQDVIWHLDEVDFDALPEDQSEELPLKSGEVVRWDGGRQFNGPWYVA